MRQTFDRLIDFSTVAITAGYKAAETSLAEDGVDKRKQTRLIGAAL
jgi:hypothetical protein